MIKKKTLLEELSCQENLRKAWNLLKKDKENSCGLSGLRIIEFNKNLDSEIRKLSEELKNNTFCFSANRAAVIKKEEGKYRPLKIPEIRDRVVLKAMSILLESELKIVLAESDDISFAYQKGKGVREAVLKIKSDYKKGDVILKADIINFFEEINKEKLLNELIFPKLKDESINELIKTSLTQKVGGLDKLKKKLRKLFKNTGEGIPQGNPLSPLLSNVYLAEFDSYVKELGYSMIRYADDFIVIISSKEEAKTVYRLLYQYLDENCFLKIHPLEENKEKTRIINPKEQELTFLSIKFDGNNLYPGKGTVGYLKSRIKKHIKDGELNDTLFFNIYKEINKWASLYSYLNIERYFDEIDTYLLCSLKKKFGGKKHKPRKCKEIVNEVRKRQCKKKTTSIWRNAKFLRFLPKIYK